MAVEPRRLAAVGDNCVDRYVPPGRPNSVGGNALNVAAGFALAGHESVYLGAVGDDADGRFVLQAAGAAGIDVDDVRVLPAATGVTIVELRPGGERAFVDEAYGASELFRLDDAGLERLRGSSWVHVANLGDARDTVARLAGAGHRVSYDFSDRGNGDLRAALAPQLAAAFISAPDVGDRAAAELARAALADGARLAVVTRGAAGSLAASDGDVHEQPAVEVEVVDTLGAGDAFIAAYVVAAVEGDGVPQALRRAAEAAARICGLIGPWPIPKEVEV
jgi:fructoselysine 6-kinase